jgi:hypothetical protein
MLHRPVIFAPILLCCFFTVPVQADMTRDDIAVLSRQGVQVIFPNETSRHPFPADIDPDTLLTAEMIDFSGVAIGNAPEFLTWLGKFTHLRKLGLRQTGIQASPELLRVFTGMEDLQKLDLSENPLFAEPYNTVKLDALWGKLPKLNELNLTATGGAVDNYGSFALLQNLATLSLGNNPQLCARSLLGRLTAWAGGNCVKSLELNKLPLTVLDLSNTNLQDDPLPDLPVATLRELSLENNALETIAERDLPQLEYWNLAGNPKVKLDAAFGSILNLKALQSLRYDSSATIPSTLIQRLAGVGKKQDTPAPDTVTTVPSTAITIPPITPQPALVLHPQTTDEMQTWLTGADKIKQQAVLDYLHSEANKGGKYAKHWLGLIHHKGWSVKMDWLQARTYYQAAEQAGDAQAHDSINALDQEAANAITEWGNTSKRSAKGQLAYDLFIALAKNGNKNAQGWLDWLKQKIG